jgi:DsbC/DsbD-like thiol-disulfide interchange protein
MNMPRQWIEAVGRWIALQLLLSCSLAAGVPAQVSIPHGAVELVAKQESIQLGQPFTIGVHFKLEGGGWHIYWVNPGDSGEPPRLEWHLPSGMQAGGIEWPAPQRLSTPPLVDYGYEGEVLLPVTIQDTSALKPGESVTLSADLRAIVCRDVCIPAKGHLSLSLPVRTQAAQVSPASAPMFRAAEDNLPRPVPPDWKLTVRDLGNEFELRARTTRSLSGAWFAPLDPQQIDNAAMQKIVTAPSALCLILKKSDQLSTPLSRLRGILVLGSKGAYLIDAPVAPSSAKAHQKEH